MKHVKRYMLALVLNVYNAMCLEIYKCNRIEFIYDIWITNIINFGLVSLLIISDVYVMFIFHFSGAPLSNQLLLGLMYVYVL